MSNAELSKPSDHRGRSRSSSPRELFGVVIRPLQTFLQTESAGGVLLLACAIAALVWANVSPSSYEDAFAFPLGVGAGGATARFTVRQLVDDGLMTLFFFVVGMEIKRELAVGELDTLPRAMLPAIAALGGMVVPAAIYLAVNRGGSLPGCGVPIATDIAFSVGVLSLLRGRVPHALLVFVTALAIFDDLGGILVIALFYGREVAPSWLLVAAGFGLVLFALNRAYVVRALPYVLVGAAEWYALHRAGVHATIAGVAVGLAVPAKARRSQRGVLRELAAHATELGERSPDEELDCAEIERIEERLEESTAPLPRMVRRFHPFVAYVVMPLFALANSGVALGGHGVASASSKVALGIAVGLFFGKPLGILGFTLAAVKLRLAPLPRGASLMKLAGASVLAGIGFTVALFIAALAFADEPDHLVEAKLGILLGSLASGVVGYVMLRSTSADARA